MTPAYRYGLAVNRVVDADTLKVDIDVGFSMLKRTTLRLAGVDAPELRSETGKAACTFTGQWLNARLPGTLIVETIKGPRTQDKFGRWLGVIYDSAGACLNEDLIAAGYARTIGRGAR